MRICSVDNCNKKYYAKDLCEKHWRQLYIFGKIKNRTIKDPNEIIVDGNICRMKLYNIDCEEIAETLFDLKYKEEIEKYKWHLSDWGYVVSNWYENGKQFHMKLHGAILYLSGQEIKNDQEIDHKDTNKLNNLETNLRMCDGLQNHHNVKIRKDNTSGQKGVSWSKVVGKWASYISNNYKRTHLGYFNTIEEAAKAYNEAAILLHGEFAVLNDI